MKDLVTGVEYYPQLWWQFAFQLTAARAAAALCQVLSRKQVVSI